MARQLSRKSNERYAVTPLLAFQVRWFPSYPVSPICCLTPLCRLSVWSTAALARDRLRSVFPQVAAPRSEVSIVASSAPWSWPSRHYLSFCHSRAQASSVFCRTCFPRNLRSHLPPFLRAPIATFEAQSRGGRWTPAKSRRSQ